MSTEKPTILFHYLNNGLSFLTGILFLACAWDLVEFLRFPQEYSSLIGAGSNLGPPYLSQQMYLRTAVSSTMLTALAFLSGFVVNGMQRRVLVRGVLLAGTFAWRSYLLS